MPQDTQRTNELLEALLSRELTNEEIVDEINGLIGDHIDEDIHLDYKHGNVLADRRTATELMREYVGAFANSAGGMLMVGINAPEAVGAQWQVTGCQAPGGGSLANWASNSLTPIAGYLSPPPVLYEVPHPDGPVLIAAVARVPSLVPCFDRGDRRPLYHLRLDHQTLAADEYLVADLVLGRRQHAYLDIVTVKAVGGERGVEPQGHYDWWFKLEFTVENQGLSRAENVMLGVVDLSGRQASQTAFPGSHLLRHVAIRPGDKKYKGEEHLRHHICVFPSLPPFEVQTVSTNGFVSVPLAWTGGPYYPYEWKAAVYVIAKDTPPTWYQLSIEVDSPLLGHLKSDNPVSSKGRFMRIERMAAGRPIVGWVGDNI